MPRMLLQRVPQALCAASRQLEACSCIASTALQVASPAAYYVRLQHRAEQNRQIQCPTLLYCLALQRMTSCCHS